MPQAYYNESPGSASGNTPPESPAVNGQTDTELYSFEGYTVESNTKVLLIPKLNNGKHG